MSSPAELGERLRTARVQQQLSLAELTERTGLPENYLEALESGNYRILPNEVYARIYFVNYARILGLDTEALLLEWPYSPSPSTAPEPEPQPAAAPRIQPGRIALALVAIVLVGWIVVQMLGDEDPAEAPPGDLAAGERGEEVPGMAPMTAEPLDTGPAVLPEPIPVPVAETAAVPIPADVSPSHALSVRARGQTWVVVEADGDTVEAQLLAAGRTIRAEAREAFVLTVGRPQSVNILLDSQQVDLPIRPGRPLVRHRINLGGDAGP